MSCFPYVMLLFLWSEVFSADKEPTYSQLLASLQNVDFDNILGDIMKAVVKPTEATTKAPKAEETANNDFNFNESFGVGVKGKSDEAKEKGQYDIGAGYEIGNVDDDALIVAGAAAIGGNAGKAIDERNFFRKGSKTLGYHKVLHKDEYKKDKVFYDENEKSGRYNNIGKGALAVLAGAGGKILKGTIDRNYAKASAGKQGSFDKKSFDKMFESVVNAKGFGDIFKNSDSDDKR